MAKQNCPETGELQAFLEGQLDELKIAEVSKHLDECTPCDETVANLEAKSDTMVNRLRQNKQAQFESDNRLPTGARLRQRDWP